MQLSTELIVSLLYKQNFSDLCRLNDVDPLNLTDPRVAQLAQLTTVLIALCCLGMGILRFGFFDSILAHSVLAGTRSVKYESSIWAAKQNDSMNSLCDLAVTRFDQRADHADHHQPAARHLWHAVGAGW